MAEVEMKQADAEQTMSDDAGVGQQQQQQAIAAPPLLLDSLPYIDTAAAHDEKLREQVQQLLQDEMSTLIRTPEEYLAEFQMRNGRTEEYSKYETPFLRAAFDALSSGAAQPSQVDLTRYTLRPPEESSVAAWRAAVDRASVALEHESNRLANLELLKKFGATAWKASNEQITHVKNKLSESLSSVQSALESVNRKRKSEQLAAGEELALLENSYYALVHKTHAIEAACQELQRQIDEKTGVQPNKQQKTGDVAAQ